LIPLIVRKNFGSMRYPCFGGFWFNAGSAYWMLGKKLLFIRETRKNWEKALEEKSIEFCQPAI